MSGIKTIPAITTNIPENSTSSPQYIDFSKRGLQSPSSALSYSNVPKYRNITNVSTATFKNDLSASKNIGKTHLNCLIQKILQIRGAKKG